MSVRVSGTNPEVDFYKDGEKIQPDGDRVKLIKDKDTGVYTLKIQDARPSDVGEYTVKGMRLRVYHRFLRLHYVKKYLSW